MGQSNCQKVPKNAKKIQNKFFLFSTVSKLLSEVQAWSVKWMWPKSATRLGKKLPKWQKIAQMAKVAKNHQSGKKSPKWQKIAKVAKIWQSGEKSSNWQKVTKVAKSPQIRLQGVSRGFRWFQVSNSMGSDDSGDLRVGTLRVRGARSGPEGPWASFYKLTIHFPTKWERFTKYKLPCMSSNSIDP